MNDVRNHLGSHFVLTADLDLADHQNWEPIGAYVPNDIRAGDFTANESLAFSGSFDGGGHTISNLTMKAINAEYDKAVELIAKNPEHKDAQRAQREDVERFREIIAALVKIPNIVIELCGSWIWVTGDTYTNRDAPKAAGCRWASKKAAWYWHAPEDGCKHSKHDLSLDEIRERHGSKLIAQTGGRPDPAKAQDTAEHETGIDGVKVVEDTTLMRVQIIFDGKPEPEVRDVLKRHGFRWAPSQGAWQRQLTNNGIYAARAVLKELAAQ